MIGRRNWDVGRSMCSEFTLSAPDFHGLLQAIPNLPVPVSETDGV